MKRTYVKDAEGTTKLIKFSDLMFMGKEEAEGKKVEFTIANVRWNPDNPATTYILFEELPFEIVLETRISTTNVKKS